MNGIGGRTIEEAQNRISYAEWVTWMKYRKKRGSLHPGMRMEHAAGMLAWMFAKANSKGDYKIYDFMPHEDEPPVISLEDAMKTWS